jgi:hypothetical protein
MYTDARGDARCRRERPAKKNPPVLAGGFLVPLG